MLLLRTIFMQSTAPPYKNGLIQILVKGLDLCIFIQNIVFYGWKS